MTDSNASTVVDENPEAKWNGVSSPSRSLHNQYSPPVQGSSDVKDANEDIVGGLDELTAPAPNPNAAQEDKLTSSPQNEPPSAIEAQEDEDGELAQETSGLDELAAPAPDQNVDEAALYRHSSLEEQRASEAEAHDRPSTQSPPSAAERRARFLEQVYIVSFLVLFSILGVLARVGVQALTLYPGALVSNTDIWANVGGSFIMGFLREDRMLFRRQWNDAVEKSRNAASDTDSGNHATEDEEKKHDDPAAAQEVFNAAKGSIPGYVGLAVGFCGSFTSFASVNRDAFLAISDDLDTAPISNYYTSTVPRGRNAGYSVMAVIAVLFMEVSMSLIALTSGAHLATAIGRWTEKLPVLSIDRVFNPLVVIVGWGAWVGTIMMAIWPPHPTWRGEVVFALVFAPLGCLLRFLLSTKLNRIVRSFPLGTFAANILGTCILGMSYDLQHSSAARSIIGCQVLQGIEDGFCGALTTVSTWVLELDTLRLRHAYFYGACSLLAATGLITAIMGSLRWTEGFVSPSCSV